MSDLAHVSTETGLKLDGVRIDLQEEQQLMIVGVEATHRKFLTRR
ncbi:hypothetical protein AS9A_P20121 (plasmid) [Hoyosella subflava DQS3-9A1]|uniref:Uncharacterized protein n=1 Tax=Hoyosella subflava (strain DSM 45089 / JCM 17490 / NBRC 109087 / DQS3-9A1) TaxID=443218 RepID=F6ESP4_HOYSD|nr:hypothetical protein AS9A_P20121 [Hoyosella subflava DQS3-9A1]